MPSAWVRKDPQLQAQLLLCNYFDMAIAAFYNMNFLFCKGKTAVPVRKNLVWYAAGVRHFRESNLKKLMRNECTLVNWEDLRELPRWVIAVAAPHTSQGADANRFTLLMKEHHHPCPPPCRWMTGRAQALITTNDRGKVYCGLGNRTWTGSCVQALVKDSM